MADILDASSRPIAPPQSDPAPRPMGPWLSNHDARAPFTYERDGRTFICCYHQGWDRLHPANAGGNHGACPDCIRHMENER